MPSTTPYPKPSKRVTTELELHTLRVLHRAASPSTIRQIQRVDEFLLWCAHRDVTPADVSPPSEILLCNYFSTFSSKTSVVTAKSHSLAIKNWVERRGFRWTGASLLDSIMTGIDKNAGWHSQKTPMTPVRLDNIRLLVNHTNSDDEHFIACRNAIASTAFYGMLRLREILFDPYDDEYRIPRVRDLTIDSVRDQYTLHLPRTKDAPRDGENILLPCIQSRTNPIYLLQQHIIINDLSPTDYLFSYRLSNGVLTRMREINFLEDCNKVWSKYNISKKTDCCFKTGGTTYHLASCVDSKVVQTMGRWNSDWFLHDLNWDDIEAVIGVHLKTLATTRILY
ncbi:hypothetical protein EV361DRAFT_811849 [Lentinula raphanica]|nr:hypothetical protein EV361DRAFT_811849 [Lentinula raphanica]